MAAKKSFLYPILVGALALALGGCLPDSKQPLPSQGDITDIAGGYLGQWLLSEVMSQTEKLPYGKIGVSLQGATHLKVVMDFSDGMLTVPATLHQYGEDIVVCLGDPEEDIENGFGPIYDIHRVELSGVNNSLLKVYPMTMARLEERIKEEAIAGEIYEMLPPKSIRITDTSSNLEAYVTSSSEVFDASPIVVFAKQ